MLFVKQTISFFILTAIFIFLPCFVFASSTDGTIDSAYKYAWNENTGLINFGAANGNVHVADSGLSGYCWMTNYGWMNLGDVTNDGEGNLGGYGWGENIGWINFAPTNGGVIIDSNGEFSGSAFGEQVGWIFFNETYKVKTDWRTRSVRPACNNSLDDDGNGLIDYPNDSGCESLTDDSEINQGGLSPSIYNPPTPPAPTSETLAGFKISINSGNEYTNKKDVVLKLFGGSDTVKMSISNSADFKDAVQIPFQTEIKWNLCESQEYICDNKFQVSSFKFQDEFQSPSYKFQVYAKFYTQYGQPSSVVSDAIILDEIPPEKPVIIYPQNKSVVKTDKSIFNGEAEKNSKVVFELFSGKTSLVKSTIISDQSGKWSYSAVLPLADGSYNFTVYAQDAAQNISDVIMSSFSVQTFVFPAEPTQHIEPTQPTQPTEPVEPIPPQPPLSGGIPTEPTEPTPAEPIEPIEPLEPVLPTEPIEPTEPAEPIEPIAPQLPTPAEPTEPVESQTQEAVVIKSVDGDIELTPDLFMAQEQKAVPEIHGLTNQKINLFVKPIKPVFAVSGQILFSGASAQLDQERKEEREKILSYSFFDFLKPSFALAQTNTDKEEPATPAGGWKIKDFNYSDDNGDGIYEAQIDLPATANNYTLRTLLYYKDGTFKSLDASLLIDPQGYVYSSFNGQEIRVNEATVSLYCLNPESKQYELWDAGSYKQKNPQITGKDGVYSFFTPPGKYYITVEAKNYYFFESQKFDVKENIPIINFSLELKRKFDWLKLFGLAAGIIVLFVAGYCAAKIRKKRKLNNETIKQENIETRKQ